MGAIADFTLNGITINATEPAPSMGPLSGAVVCFVGTAPDKPGTTPLNEPIRITQPSQVALLLGTLGTLPVAFNFLFKKVRPIAYAIVVEDVDGDAEATRTRVIGGVDALTGQRTGIAAIGSAQDKPTIIAAPGFNTTEVGQALSSEAKVIYATPIIDGPDTNTAAAIAFADTFNEDNLIVGDPWAVSESMTIPASVMIAAAMASISAWESPQNQGLPISELTRPIGYSINDPASEHNELNKNGVTTFAHTRLGGYSLIGNRTNTGRFISHVGLENALARKLEETSQPLMGQNLTKQFIDSIVSRLNNWVQSLVAQGAIPAANIYLHPELNNVESYNSGRWYLVMDYGRYSPNEHMVYGLSVNNDIIERFVENLS